MSQLSLAQIELYDELKTILPNKEAALELSQTLAPWLAVRLNSEREQGRQEIIVALNKAASERGSDHAYAFLWDYIEELYVRWHNEKPHEH